MPALPIPDAERYLSERDPVIGAVIARNGPCTLGRRRMDPFHALATSIISQQLSTKAADTIAGRVTKHVGANGRFRPQHFSGARHTALRACGLSNAKAKWLVSIARMTEAGDFSFRRLVNLPDEEAIESLDALPGVGRWTAEMFLIFSLHRPDIFSMGDLGLRRGVDLLYGRGRKLSERRTLQVTKAWAPYRSVASWHLWRMQDADTQAWD